MQIPLTFLFLALLHSFTHAGDITGPVIPPPGKCYLDTDCSSSDYCEFNNIEPALYGPCVPKLGLGKDCNSTQCQEGLYCDGDAKAGFTCRSLIPKGETCTSSGQFGCENDLLCDADTKTCGDGGKEGAKCTFDSCSKQFYCFKEIEGSAEGVCTKRVDIGGKCPGLNVFGCCEIGAAIDFDKDATCQKLKKEDEKCSSDVSCEKGSKCIGDQLAVFSKENGTMRCTAEANIIKKAGKECSLEFDKCDDDRLLVCRKQGTKSICVHELYEGIACNPGGVLETCLNETDAAGNTVEYSCLEIIDKGKATGQYKCQEGKAANPPSTPTPSARPDVTKSGNCQGKGDCKSNESCKNGKCVRRECTAKKEKKCKDRCKTCDPETGRCKGGCEDRKFCMSGKCEGMKIPFPSPNY